MKIRAGKKRAIKRIIKIVGYEELTTKQIRVYFRLFHYNVRFQRQTDYWFCFTRRKRITLI